MEQQDKKEILAGVIGLIVFICIIILTINSCKMRRMYEQEREGSVKEEITANSEELQEQETNATSN